MYGTIARMQIKPGQGAALLELAGRWAEGEPIPGFISEHVFRMDAEPDIFYLSIVFDSKESYFANASNPEQDVRYRQMLPYIVGEPSWHDGEIVFSTSREKVSQGL